MPSWCLGYLLVFIAISAGGLHLEVRDGCSWRRLAGGLGALLAGVLFIKAYWTPELAGQLGWWVVPMLVFAVGWEAASGPVELRAVAAADDYEIEAGPWDRAAATALGMTIVAPAYIMGLFLCLRLVGWGG